MNMPIRLYGERIAITMAQVYTGLATVRLLSSTTCPIKTNIKKKPPLPMKKHGMWRLISIRSRGHITDHSNDYPSNQVKNLSIIPLVLMQILFLKHNTNTALTNLS